MITEDYVSFETAKLLKEKGFEGQCSVKQVCIETSHNEGSEWTTESEVTVDIPTLQMAMKWLREVHSLYIDIVTSFSQDGICYTFSCSNTMDLIQGIKGTSYHEYQSYEEACEAAIKYCLENLI